MLTKFLLKFKFSIFSLIIIRFLHPLLNLIIPILISILIDDIAQLTIYDIKIKFLLLFIVYFIIEILSFIERVLTARLSAIISNDINLSIMSKVFKSKYEDIKSFNPIYLSDRIRNDSFEITSFFLEFIKNIVSNTLNLICLIILIYNLLYKKAIYLLLYAIIYISIYFLFRQLLTVKKEKNLEVNNRYFSFQTFNYLHIKQIKIFNCLNKVLSKTKVEFNNVYKSNMQYAATSSIYFSLLNISANFLILILLFYSFVGIKNDTFSLGNITVVISYTSILINSISYFSDLGKRYSEYITTKKRIVDIMNLDNEVETGIQINKILNISVESLCFSFKNKEIFKDLSLKLYSGKIYGLIGNNGLGKSTLCEILLGFYENYTGNIFINDIDLKLINLKTLRNKAVTYISQDFNIFSSDIYDNAMLFLDDFDKCSFKENLRKLKLDKIDKNLVNSSTYKFLSGGEIKKIGVLFSLLKTSSSFIIFDETFSNIDKDTRIIIFEHLQIIKKDTIILIISHEEGFENYVDEIIRI